jgi:hypothetical protein
MAMQFLTPHTQDIPVAAAGGQMFVIRCEPDPFTGERINVGVCVVTAGGQRLARCIEEPGRLECLYGPGAASVITLAKMAAACAAQGLPSPSPQIIFDAPLPYYHAKAEDILRLTFQEQITVALPQRQGRTRPQIDDAAALALVLGELRKLVPMLGEVVANTPVTLVNTPQGPRPVTVPLQPRHGVGAVRSADYTPTSLKAHLMDSVLDLQCAALYRQRTHQALFLLRPPKEPPKLAMQRDDVIDNVMYRAGAVHLLQSDNSEQLAADIVAWAEQAA